ncbi:Flp pilus assembly protein CpaB [Photobacterium rosenbergii]|uniref:Flp pilus assembly protein CpaB n=1 Tax=Photobacterium rosenbergii TaxID=294936 RepID=A0ABU3ZEZ2_9GAMM|nr:Flp pilus assembly protein CpaB [Photobacterium rosenbergii]MDV5168679.1 Flp pilus assembly protein CpaB [Photobacterium rosenbergii]
MQEHYLKIAAAMLIGLALLIGVYGIFLGQPETQRIDRATPKPLVTVVRYTSNLPAGTLLSADMIETAPITDPMAGDIRDPQQYLGRRLAFSVRAGSRLRDAQFALPRPLLDALEPGYRALALRSDALVIVGGHLRSGDWVDVLYLLRANKESGHNSTARRLLSRVKVLAVGAETGVETAAATQTSKQSNKRKSASSGGAGTLVLAVPEEEVTQLMLAESTGQIRLALVGTQEPLTASASHVISLRSLGEYKEVDVVAPKPKTMKYRYVAPQVEIYQGEERTLVRTRN